MLWYDNKIFLNIFWFRYHYPDRKDWGDATRIIPTDLPDFDLLVGGFPCQTFSIAGKRKGMEETRGTLFFEIARILKVKRPSNFILENVRGILSAGITDEGGKTIEGTKGFVFKIIIATLAELGYCVEWEVCNSVGFGVPQNRERVFIVGHLRKGGSGKIFPLQEGNELYNTKIKRKREIVSTIRSGMSGVPGSGETYVIGTLDEFGFRETQNSSSIDANYSKGRGRDGQRPMILEQIGNIDTKGNNSLWGRVYSPEGIAPNLNAEGGGLGAKTGLYAVASRGRGEGWRQQYEARKDNYTNSLTGVQKDNMLSDGIRIRRLTPIECERLQAFPDDYTKHGIDEKGKLIEISDSQRYKVLGNAVTTVVIEELIRRLYNL
ncbi:MAG: DNA (cytosine-5-)-methyltransferase [Candidatus Paceibacterota bacterium]|jgi:DNA (cytosine-5)-methyltransferase 1